MSLLLKQSTAVTVKIGPFVDDTDFKTAETALTISQADIRLSKNGGAFAQSNNAAGATHDASGYYGIPLDTTDTNTLGTLRLFVAESGALQVWQDFMVVPANMYDSLVGGSDALDVSLVQWLGSAPDALSSGKVAADLKLWLTAAPAALSANGYVQAMLLRWLTDNAGGTPSALSSGNVTGDTKLIEAGDATDALVTGALAALATAVTQPGQGTPVANQTYALMLAYLYKAWRNRSTQTATQYNLFNDDAATVDQKATVSDDAVTTDRGEIATGP